MEYKFQECKGLPGGDISFETLLDQGSCPPMEDALFAACPVADWRRPKDNYFGLFSVFDGGPSLELEEEKPLEYLSDNKKTLGQEAIDIATRVMSEYLGNQRLLCPDICVQTINAEIHQYAYRHREIPEAILPHLATTAAVVDIDFENNAAHWCWCGNSPVIFVRRGHRGETVIRYSSMHYDREFLKIWKEINFQKKKNGQGRKFFKELLKPFEGKIKKLKEKINVEYGLLNGDRAADKFIFRSGFDPKPLDNIEHIILCTDGFLPPQENPGRGRAVEELVKVYLKSGLKGVYENTRHKEAQDPDCQKYTHFRRNDDIAAIAINLTKRL